MKLEFELPKYATSTLLSMLKIVFRCAYKISFDINVCKRKLKVTPEYWNGGSSEKWKWKKNLKEYHRRTRKVLETKLYCRNLIKGITTWAVSLVRYSGQFLKWTRKKLQQIDQRTRKLMTSYEVLHPTDNIERLYMSKRRKRTHQHWRERGCINTKTWRQHKKEQRLPTATRNEAGNVWATITKKQKWQEKQCGYLKRQTGEISREKTWTWLRNGNLKRETESLLIAA